MKRKLLWQGLIVACLGLVLAGCGKPALSGGEEGHDRSLTEGESPVKFKEGIGLQLSAETSAALGLRTGEVEERSVRHIYELTASVFDAGPPARASSLVPGEVAGALEKHPPSEAKLLTVHRELSSAMTQVEVVFAVPGNPPVGSTISLTLRGPASTGSAVPRSALLRTATGTFVYVTNGANLLRTPVKPGASDDEFIEILDGLYAGDVIVTEGVEQLWLTELRLTKGGGHSH